MAPITLAIMRTPSQLLDKQAATATASTATTTTATAAAKQCAQIYIIIFHIHLVALVCARFARGCIVAAIIWGDTSNARSPSGGCEPTIRTHTHSCRAVAALMVLAEKINAINAVGRCGRL